MGKRSWGTFERSPRDYYPTPRAAVLPLIPHLEVDDYWYVEPCAGDGALIDVLVDFGYFGEGSDVDPQRGDIARADALFDELPVGTRITNPPWDRTILHPLIETLSEGGKTWLLFDADWLHTKQAAPFMPRLRKIVSVGRVKWIPNSPTTGKDNCCWYLFTGPSSEPTQFFGRQMVEPDTVWGWNLVDTKPISAEDF